MIRTANETVVYIVSTTRKSGGEWITRRLGRGRCCTDNEVVLIQFDELFRYHNQHSGLFISAVG